MQHQLMFGSRLIDFTLHYRERKSLSIKVLPDASVEVMAPLNTKEDKVLEKVKNKGHWLLKQIDYFNSYKPTTPPRRFVNGETHLYLGRQYKLKIVLDKENAIKAYRGQLWIHAKASKPELLKEQLNDWYREKAMVVFKELLEEVIPRFKRYKVANPSVSIRAMSRRWGSCTSTGKIILNTELIKAPKGSIEYVIIHELCHLVHRGHNKAFFNLQSRMMPDWKKWKERLEYSLN